MNANPNTSPNTTPRRPLWRSLAVTAVILLAAAGIVAGIWIKQQPQPPQRLTCADLTQGCQIQLGQQQVEIRTSERIQPMLPFELWVAAPQAQRVEASFAMVGMNMGFNRYSLKPAADARHHARITLPFCISGRGDWLLTLDLDGARVEIPFAVENTVNMNP